MDIRKRESGSSFKKIKEEFRIPQVLNLRPTWFRRYPLATAVVSVLLILSAIFGMRQLSTRAEIKDFYPATCLGNWQNSANAEGKPETVAAPDSSFTRENSAVYSLGTQIFCGGFVPDSVATSGVITNVGLTLIWQIGDAPTVPATSFSAPAATSSPDSSSDGASSTGDVLAPSSTAVSTPTSSGSAGDGSSSGSAGTDDSVIPPPSTTTPDVPVPPDDSSASATGTSLSAFHALLSRLIPLAFADDAVDSTTDAVASSDNSSTVILGPPLVANLAAASSALTDATETATSTLAPIVPSVPDENFLDVSYSTDGETWISIGKISTSNWQKFTVTLPISNWAALQNLQIRVEGIPTTQDPMPPIYLDGMLMEVHYDLPSLLNPMEMATSTDEEASSTSLVTPAPPQRIVLVNPGAEQTCDVQPFSQALPLGGTVTFMVNLHPSINGMSYDLQAGHLPSGISAGFSSPGGPIAATSTLTFQAETSTLPGSLNIAVIYHEHEEDGTVLANFCQLNIDVK